MISEAFCCRENNYRKFGREPNQTPIMESQFYVQQIVSDPIFNVETCTLENGLKVLFNKDPKSKKVYLNVYVKSGAVDDPPGKKGLAHLYEHLAFRKGEGNSFFRGMGNIGMYCNAGTAYYYMFFRSEGPGVHFQKSLELESLRFGKVHEGLSQNSIDNEIEIIRSEALESYKHPITCLDRIIRKSLFIQPEPYAWDILGDYCDLRSVKVHDIEQYGQQHFSPDNTILVISGNFTMNYVVDLVNKYFGNKRKSGGNTISPAKAEVRLEKSENLYYILEGIKDGLYVSYKGTELFSENWVPVSAALIYLCLNNGPLTTAPINPVAKKGIHFFDSMLFGNGYFFFPIQSENFQKGYDTYVKTLQNIKVSSITELQVTEVKELLLKKVHDIIDSSRKYIKMNRLFQLNETLGIPSCKPLIDRIARLNREDILEAAVSYVINSKHNTVSVVRSGNEGLVLPGAVRIPEDLSWIEPTPSDSPDETTTWKPFNDIEAMAVPVMKHKMPAVWRFRLSNGIKVYGSGIRDCKIIKGKIRIMVGRNVEQEGVSGINYYCKEVMYGKYRQDLEALNHKIEMMDSSVSVETTPEDIEINFESNRNNIVKLIRLIERTVLNPRINDSLIKHIKDNIGISTKPIYDDMEWGFFRVAFGEKHPYTQIERGVFSSQERINASSVKEHMDKYFRPDITNVCIAGDVSKDFCKEIFAPLESEWQGKHQPLPPLQDPIPQKKGEVYIFRHRTRHIINMSFFRMAPPPTTRENYLLSILTELLGGRSVGSFLYYNLREKTGLVYNTHAGLYTTASKSYFRAGSYPYARNAEKVFWIMKDTIFSYPDNFNETIFRYTINHAIYQRNLNVDSLDKQLDSLTWTADHHLRYNLRKFQDSILKDVTFAEMKELARKFFDPSEFYFIVQGEKDNLDKYLPNI